MRFIVGWTILFVCFCWANTVEAQVVQRINGNCNVIIYNNSGNINLGNIHYECKDADSIDKIKDLETKYNNNINRINDNYEDVKKINKKLENIEKIFKQKLSSDESEFKKLRTEQNTAKKNLQDLWNSHKLLQDEVASTLSTLPGIVGEAVQGALADQQQLLELVINKKIETASRKLRDEIDLTLQENESRLENLEKIVFKLQNDVSFLMSEYLKGNLLDSIGFFSGSVGAWHSQGSWAPKFSAEYERLIPSLGIGKIRASVYGEIAWLNWNETLKFETLPGISESKLTSNHNITYVSLGTRIFMFSLGEHLHQYALLSAGHSIAGNEDTFSYTLGAGIEYARKSTRASLEARWESFSSIEQVSATFNAFGNASVVRSREPWGGLLLSARIAFR